MIMENFTCKYNDKYFNSLFVNQAVLVPSIFKELTTISVYYTLTDHRNDIQMYM